jgi:hypothetical protein
MGCSKSRSFNSLTNQSTLSVGRADVWWYYGGPLLETVPGNWTGTCALVQLAIPFTLAFGSPSRATTSRKRREIDMMLTKKGGVCIMIGVLCCTHILNNTAPDESVAKTLWGSTTLSNKLAENSGINDPFTDLIENWFGRWKGWMTSILTSLIIVAGVLILVGCCIIPCVRELVQWLTETALTKKSPHPTRITCSY